MKYSPGFYRTYASLFREGFPEVSEIQVEMLNRAGLHCYKAALLVDSAVDEDSGRDCLAALGQFRDSLRLLLPLFEGFPCFWSKWDCRHRDFEGSISMEKELSGRKAVSFKEYGQLASAKSALSLLAIDGLFVLNGSNPSSQSIYDSLLSSHFQFSLAFQLYDDLVDLAEDFGSNRFNWVLFSYFRDATPADFPDARKRFYLNGKAQEVFEKIMELLDRAIDLSMVSGLWESELIKFREEVGRYRQITLGFIQSAKSSLRQCRINAEDPMLEVPFPENPTIKRGAAFLGLQMRRRWPGLRNFMHFAKGEGFADQSGIHGSDLFFRSIVGCLLLEMQPTVELPKEYIERELGYFLRQRRQHAGGYWSYFPSLRYLSADIDDIAQVARFFLRSGQREALPADFSALIEHHLETGRDAGGIPKTWVFPKERQNDGYALQSWLNRTKWGEGPHAEVVANFADFLLDYSPGSYPAVHEATTSYLMAAQTKLGAWSSRWYHGFAYGNYAITRYLKRRQAMSGDVLDRLMAYMKRSQNLDGGFGTGPDETTDPLSTALTALCLMNLDKARTPMLVRAIESLERRQRREGCWEAVPFVIPRPGQSFKSAVVTSAYALNALVSYDQHGKD